MKLKLVTMLLALMLCQWCFGQEQLCRIRTHIGKITLNGNTFLYTVTQEPAVTDFYQNGALSFRVLSFALRLQKPGIPDRSLKVKKVYAGSWLNSAYADLKCLAVYLSKDYPHDGSRPRLFIDFKFVMQNGDAMVTSPWHYINDYGDWWSR